MTKSGPAKRRGKKKAVTEAATDAPLFPFFDALNKSDGPLPWQRQQWRRVLERSALGRLPQTWLLEGQAGLGKRLFAYGWMQWLHCQRVTMGRDQASWACGQCNACVQVRAGTQADTRWVRPENVGGQIKVDQVRDVIRFMAQTAKQGAHRVVVIEPVEAMNPAAQNALLKTLEEPGVGAYFLLVCHRPVAVLPTILSRCQRLCFTAPDADEALNWLSRLPEGVLPATITPEAACNALPSVSGAPLTLLEQLHTPWFEARASLEADLASVATGDDQAMAGSKKTLSQLVDAWLEWPAVDRITVVVQQAQARIKAVMRLPEVSQSLRREASDQTTSFQAELYQAFGLYDELMSLYQLASGPNSINDRLLWEKVIITWGRLVRLLPLQAAV